MQDKGDSHVFFVNSLSKSAIRIICEVKIKRNQAFSLVMQCLQYMNKIRTVSQSTVVATLYIRMDKVLAHYACTFENSDLHFHFHTFDITG